MKVRSTGLGKTELTTQASAMMNDPEDKSRLIFKIEAIEPVHWMITAFIEGKDLRKMAWMALKNPGFLFRALLIFLRG